MAEEKVLYVDDFMSDGEDEDLQSKTLNKQEYESKKAQFDVQKIIGNFLLKKQYFIQEKKNEILDDYILDDKVLGAGAYGTVYRATDKKTGQARAIKKVESNKILNYDGFIGEVQALKQLDHPNIIKLYEVYSLKEWIYLVEEWCEGGELFDYIIENEFISEKEAARLFHQMVSSILYCHKNCICHRDLKPDNFMLSSKDEESTIKLIDFGLSRSFFKPNTDGKSEMMRMETRAGSSLYMAPEVLTKDYSSSWDVWSLGVILYVMMCKNMPFNGKSDAQIHEAILSYDYDFDDEVWQSRSSEVKDLLSLIFVPEEERLTPKEVLNHDWIKNTLDPESGKKINSSYMSKLSDYKSSNQLKKAILTFLATNVNHEEIKEEIELFHQFDANYDGYITKKELKKGLDKIK